MKNYLDPIPKFCEELKKIREIILTNIVLLGQIPAPTFLEKRRADLLLERMAELDMDECTTDSYGNPIGIIRGKSSKKPPIFIEAHLDTFAKDPCLDHDFIVTDTFIKGAGVSDNSTGVGVLASLPEIIKRLDLKFDSDIILISDVESLGKGNLKGIRNFLKVWTTPIRGAICLESVEFGRLNYYSEGMIRAEIECNIEAGTGWQASAKPNAILVINEAINEILKLRLPQKPITKIVIGKISGGFKHGQNAFDSSAGFEIRSDSDDIVKEIFNDIKDIVTGISHRYGVILKLKRISNRNTARINFNHPLVKSASGILKTMGMVPICNSSESALSIFLSKKIPAVTVGITHGNNYRQQNAMVEIAPIYKGIAQILSLLMAIDSGVCDV
ncbi:M20/M25/M40 family metallo-hydrolase [Desulfobacterales bacterium HSG16]|nr:M20/M25/M40 family metallo-hydrolase [Desulfobacterales bacterium HSG16]